MHECGHNHDEDDDEGRILIGFEIKKLTDLIAPLYLVGRVLAEQEAQRIYATRMAEIAYENSRDTVLGVLMPIAISVTEGVDEAFEQSEAAA